MLGPVNYHECSLSTVKVFIDHNDDMEDLSDCTIRTASLWQKVYHEQYISSSRGKRFPHNGLLVITMLLFLVALVILVANSFFWLRTTNYKENPISLAKQFMMGRNNHSDEPILLRSTNDCTYVENFVCRWSVGEGRRVHAWINITYGFLCGSKKSGFKSIYKSAGMTKSQSVAFDDIKIQSVVTGNGKSMRSSLWDESDGYIMLDYTFPMTIYPTSTQEERTVVISYTIENAIGGDNVKSFFSAPWVGQWGIYVAQMDLAFKLPPEYKSSSKMEPGGIISEGYFKGTDVKTFCFVWEPSTRISRWDWQPLDDDCYEVQLKYGFAIAIAVSLTCVGTLCCCLLKSGSLTCLVLALCRSYL